MIYNGTDYPLYESPILKPLIMKNKLPPNKATHGKSPSTLSSKNEGGLKSDHGKHYNLPHAILSPTYDKCGVYADPGLHKYFPRVAKMKSNPSRISPPSMQNELLQDISPMMNMTWSS